MLLHEIVTYWLFTYLDKHLNITYVYSPYSEITIVCSPYLVSKFRFTY